ncbi:flavodoxin [Ornithinibacillus sp. L9]|uniref:Flavodoxin n=1 Tax=Ornithinibacillus caprae TaxID=2678566 RepID=A0A6N8FP47_9BACI|nr:flavodoxin domain-containing protein [Ornithinibacillus caprae]MUK90354.1 flavodoxin [Ornithinibacillus caprae]
MRKVLLAYSSMTGNTELMAQTIGDYLIEKKHDVITKSFDFDTVEVKELLDYDAVLIGTLTWVGGGLPFDVEDFYDELDNIDLSGKIVGVFGSADSLYEVFGGAVDIIADRAESLGANVMPKRLTIDLEPDENDLEQCQELAEMVNQALEKNS